MRNYTAISFASLVVVESIWWFSLLAVVGGMFGLGGSPLPWGSVLIVLAVGVFAAWIFGGGKGAAATMAIYQGAVAFVAVYLALATVTVTDSWSFKPAWPVDTFGGTYGAEGVVDVILAVIAAVWLWYRAQSMFVEGGVARRLSRAFKIGTAFIAIGLLVEYGAIRSDIGISPLILPFFGAALIGMAASRIPQSESNSQASWPLVIAVSVGAILGLGAIGGVLTGRYGDVGVRGLVNLWGAFVDAMLWILRYPLEWIMTAIWNLILWLQSLSERDEEGVEQEPPGPLSEEMVNPAVERAEDATNFAIEALRWPLSILLLVVLFFVLVFAYRRFSSRLGEEEEAIRESIRGDADARADMAKLLTNLLPSWARSGKKRSLWKWPEGEVGVAEAFLLYFDTLTHAIKRGMTYEPNETPNERMDALTVFLPGAPVGAITSTLNAACYGAVPGDIDEIAQLRQQVELAAKKPKPGDMD